MPGASYRVWVACYGNYIQSGAPCAPSSPFFPLRVLGRKQESLWKKMCMLSRPHREAHSTFPSLTTSIHHPAPRASPLLSADTVLQVRTCLPTHSLDHGTCSVRRELSSFIGYFLTSVGLARPPGDLSSHLCTLGRAWVIWGGQEAVLPWFGDREGPYRVATAAHWYQFTQWTVRLLVQSMRALGLSQDLPPAYP